MDDKKWNYGTLIAFLALAIPGLIYVITLGNEVETLKATKSEQSKTVQIATDLANVKKDVENLKSGEVIETMKATALDEIGKRKGEILEEIKAKEESHVQLFGQAPKLPVGVIIDYIGPIESSAPDASEMLRDGHFTWVKDAPNWAITNGATIPESSLDLESPILEFDADPTRDGFQVPNLINRFTKGVLIEDLGSPGGFANKEIDLSHSHPVKPCGDANGRNALRAQNWHDHVRMCNERSASNTDRYSKKVTLDNDPLYFGVLKIIRIK